MGGHSPHFFGVFLLSCGSGRRAGPGASPDRPEHRFPPVRSNIKPDKANANHHSFQMYTFDKATSCKACRMFLRCGPWESSARPWPRVAGGAAHSDTPMEWGRRGHPRGTSALC